MQHTPLFEAHRQRGARMIDFAGWQMPVQYPTGIMAEHRAVRTTCGVFDLSHMGRVVVRGPAAVDLARWCCTRDVARLRPGSAAYSVLCLTDGGILDDIIVSMLAPDELLVVVNASRREQDIEWIEQQRAERGLLATLEDRTASTALIGIQGPSAQHTLQALTTLDLGALAGYQVAEQTIAGVATLISRTGYTGEDGFELMLPAADAESVWNALLELPDVVPCGLGARDTLRLEAGFALYGNDIDSSTNPYEARLGWVVDLDRDDFSGRAALSAIHERGPTRRLVGLTVGRGGVPRAGYPVMHDDQPVGQVTSGTFSPTLEQNIALGYVPLELSQSRQPLAVVARGQQQPAHVARLPFVAHRSRAHATIE